MNTTNLWELVTLMSTKLEISCPCKTLMLVKKPIPSLKLEKNPGFYSEALKKFFICISESYLFVQDSFAICVS